MHIDTQQTARWDPFADDAPAETTVNSEPPAIPKNPEPEEPGFLCRQDAKSNLALCEEDGGRSASFAPVPTPARAQATSEAAVTASQEPLETPAPFRDSRSPEPLHRAVEALKDKNSSPKDQLPRNTPINRAATWRLLLLPAAMMWARLSFWNARWALLLSMKLLLGFGKNILGLEGLDGIYERLARFAR